MGALINYINEKLDIEHYKVLFAHRVNPKGDGMGYDEGGWNLPNVAWWLDLELPI